MAVLEAFTIKQGDTAEPIIIAAEYDDGTPVKEDLTGATVEFHMKAHDGTIIIAAGAADVIDPTSLDPPLPVGTKVVGYQWVTGDTEDATPGPESPNEAEFEITLSDGRILTVPNGSNILVHVPPQIA